jgi:uncharacterized protein (TIGR02246 family)
MFCERSRPVRRGKTGIFAKLDGCTRGRENGRTFDKESNMSTDEQEIRQLVSTWMTASMAGDTDTVLSLMSDDVVFLVPGRPPMRKADFAAVAKEQTGSDAPSFEGTSEIQEIKIVGDWAFMWTKLTVVVTPPGGAPPVTRAGHTLSILNRQNGKWVLARDANLLAPIAK